MTISSPCSIITDFSWIGNIFFCARASPSIFIVKTRGKSSKKHLDGDFKLQYNAYKYSGKLLVCAPLFMGKTILFMKGEFSK